jgi:hypothetical protein
VYSEDAAAYLTLLRFPRVPWWSSFLAAAKAPSSYLKLVCRAPMVSPTFESERKIAKKNGISSTRASRGEHLEEQGCRIRVLLASQHMRTV